LRRPNRLALYGLNIRLQGRMRWISLGTEADLTPSQARSEAERIRGLKRQGQDPASERDRRKGALSVDATVARYMEEHVRPAQIAYGAHYAETFDRLTSSGSARGALTALVSDVAQWHSHGGDAEANRALAILSSLMSWTARLKWRDDNPCHGVARYKERTVNRYPTAAHLARIAEAMDELVEEGALNPYFAAGTKVMMITGARRSEIFEAQWPWLDIDRQSLTLPDSKTGAKTIALPDVALELILRLPRVAGCRWSSRIIAGQTRR
jgi:integrase